MWKKSFLFHEKRAKLSIIQNLFILVIGIICVYYGFSMSEGEISTIKAIFLAILLVLGFDLSFMTLLIILDNKFPGNFSFNKLYFGLCCIVVSLLFNGIRLGLEKIGINNSLILVISIIIIFFCGLLGIILIILGITELKTNKKRLGNTKSNKKNNSNKDLKTASFLLSLVIGIMSFGFLTGGGGKIVIPVILQSNMKAFIISIFVLIVSYYLVHRKLIKIDKKKPGFISKTFFNRAFDGDVNYDVGYETYYKIVKEIKEDYEKTDLPINNKKQH